MTEFISLKDAQVTAGPPGNRLYLVCSKHPDVDDSIMLGKRLEAEYHRAPSATELNRWFEEHAECGRDCFQLAYAKIPGWDTPIEGKISPVTEAVKLALVKA